MKRLANVLDKNPLAVVLRAMLTKQGDKPNKNVERRLVMVNSKEIKWYHDEDEMKRGKRPLGIIYLASVYHCVPANTKMNTVDINVRFSQLMDYRSVPVLGGRKIRTKKAGESSYLVRGISPSVMNGSLVSSIYERKPSTKALSPSFATSPSSRTNKTTIMRRHPNSNKGSWKSLTLVSR